MFRLAFRGIGIVSVRIARPDLSVAVVNEQFRFLSSGDVSGSIDSFFLGLMNGTRFPARRAADRPSPFVSNDMLISFPHCWFSL